LVFFWATQTLASSEILGRTGRFGATPVLYGVSHAAFLDKRSSASLKF
jgi:hypothetical protein